MKPGSVVFRWAVRVSGFLLALAFVLAGGSKVADPAAFAEEVMRYQLVPWAGAVVVALWLPYLEILGGLGLLWRPVRAGARLVVTVLLLTFTGVLISALRRGLNLDCGCFGRLTGPTTVTQAFWRDFGLLALTAFLWAPEFAGRVRRITAAEGDKEKG
ncbi:MAG TPA: MauE/DoxX family redox-associated membrane protein [Chthoniobacterales bacterium]